jgi:hypothetical protein
MHVEVAFQLDELSAKLEIPWKGPDPASRYLDLRSDPGALQQLEQARRHLPLRNFLAAVNSADSIFATAKCATWLNQDVRIGAGTEPYEFASSIDLIFALNDLNFEQQQYEGLTARLKELLTRDAPSDSLRAKLAVRRCHFRVFDRWGFSLTICLHARGATPEQAELRWGLGLARLQQALLFLSRVVRHELARSP